MNKSLESIKDIDWISISMCPPENKSLLVRMSLVGPIYDVAIYKGILGGGERRWIMGNIHLDQNLITHWAEITEPNEVSEKLKLLTLFIQLEALKEAYQLVIRDGIEKLQELILTFEIKVREMKG